MKIELLYFDGCPNHNEARRLLKQVLAEEGVNHPINLVHVADEAEAERVRFIGSPSIRIDGQDIDPSRRGDAAYYGCRLYPNNPENKGLPEIGDIRNAMRKALGRPSTEEQGSNGDRKSLWGLMAGSSLAALAASACCWGPGLFLGFGVGAVGAVGLTAWRPYLGVVVLGLLAGAFFLVYRKRASACCVTPKETRRLKQSRLAFWIVAGIALAGYSYPHWSGTGGLTGQEWAGSEVYEVSGMTCQSCADGVCSIIKNTPGVKDATVDYKTGKAHVVWESEPKEGQMAQAVEEGGFGIHRTEGQEEDL